MTSLARVQDFLECKRFAFVGLSRLPKDFSRALFREFRARGYEPVPVHPLADEIEGVRCFARVREIQPPVDRVLLMTSPGVVDVLVRECAESGIRQVWLYRGAGQGCVTPSAVEFCEAQGIAVIPGECPFMFFEGGAWFHRAHGFVRKILHSYPG